MTSPLYALVAYVHNSVGLFVENLRRTLNPEHPELPAHITILPPRTLQGPSEDALRHIQQVCSTVQPFEVIMGDVETFAPITPTIFIRVQHGAYRIRELHDRMNMGALAFEEPWPYMPHLTVIKLTEMESALAGAETARQQWAQFAERRRILIDRLTFVREGESLFDWIDLAPIPLGPKMAESKR
jgi:2'-5' RNA ligase